MLPKQAWEEDPGRKSWGGPQFIAAERITAERITPRAAWRATISEPVTPRAATRLSGKIRLQARLLRAEISLRPGHCVSACPAGLITPRAATAFRQDTASSKNTIFSQDYYALKSHCVPTITSRLALPKPSRRAPRRVSGKNTAFTQDYYALKSHYVPAIASRLALQKPSRRAPRRLSGKIRLSRKIITH